MIRIGKYKYLVDLQKSANLDSTSAYFILEFEYDSKFYVGWTGETRAVSVKTKIDKLIYSALKGANWPSKNNPELAKAIAESKYITVTTEEIPFDKLGAPNGLIDVYSRLYELIDEYSAYAPYGHNIINSLNKCAAEKLVIPGFAAKWNIPDTIHKSGASNLRSYPHRVLYQYRRISENLYKLHKKWDSVKEFIDSVAPMKINPSAIYMCCNGQRRIAYGDIWKFDGNEEIIEITPDMRKVKVTSIKKLEAEAENRVNKFKAEQLRIKEALKHEAE